MDSDRIRQTGPDSGLSLHQRILSDIEGKILSGEWPPGTRIPFEMELVALYGCSRMTVNKALSQLAKSGLIERRKKSGSFVTRPQAQSAVLEIHDIRDEVASLGATYRYRLAGRVTRRASARECADLNLETGAKVVAIDCLHYAGDKPFCSEARLINIAAVPEAGGETFAEIAPGPWLLKQVPWSSAEHRIVAINADPATARLLDIAEGTACLRIVRRTQMAGQTVTRVELTYPGDAFELVASFAPSQA